MAIREPRSGKVLVRWALLVFLAVCVAGTGEAQGGTVGVPKRPKAIAQEVVPPGY